MINLRPHHILCTLFFEEKGYNEEFIYNMKTVIKDLKQNPYIKLTKNEDIICRKCPNNENGVGCINNKKVQSYDKKILNILKLNTKESYKYSSIQNLIIKKIIFPGKRKQICKDCEWEHICNKKEKNLIHTFTKTYNTQ